MAIVRSQVDLYHEVGYLTISKLALLASRARNAVGRRGTVGFAP